MKLGCQLDVTNTSSDFVSDVRAFRIVKRIKFVLGVNFTQIGSQCIALRLVRHDHPREHNNRRANCDVKMELGRPLLNLGSLVGCRLPCSIENGLHLPELDSELHDLSERLGEEIDLD